MQTLMLDTITGPRSILAPTGWEFDKTATIVWARLLTLYRRANKPFKTQRDRLVHDGKIEIIALVLASALGMATPYWQNAARDIVRAER